MKAGLALVVLVASREVIGPSLKYDLFLVLILRGILLAMHLCKTTSGQWSCQPLERWFVPLSSLNSCDPVSAVESLLITGVSTLHQSRRHISNIATICLIHIFPLPSTGWPYLSMLLVCPDTIGKLGWASLTSAESIQLLVSKSCCFPHYTWIGSQRLFHAHSLLSSSRISSWHCFSLNTSIDHVFGAWSVFEQPLGRNSPCSHAQGLDSLENRIEWILYHPRGQIWPLRTNQHIILYVTSS